MSERDDERRNRIPTPEEVEQGNPASSRSRDSSADKGPDARNGLFRRLRRRGSVGRKRTYVEPMDASGSTDTALPSPDPVVSPEEDRPKDNEVRVRSVKMPSRTTDVPNRSHQGSSPATRFNEQAEAKGHRMGALFQDPDRDDTRIAVCENCGLSGELVTQREENYANVLWDFARGAAIERTCPGVQMSD